MWGIPRNLPGSEPHQNCHGSGPSDPDRAAERGTEVLPFSRAGLSRKSSSFVRQRLGRGSCSVGGHPSERSEGGATAPVPVRGIEESGVRGAELARDYCSHTGAGCRRGLCLAASRRCCSRQFHVPSMKLSKSMTARRMRPRRWPRPTACALFALCPKAPAAARNAGAEIARGELLVFTEAD